MSEYDVLVAEDRLNVALAFGTEAEKQQARRDWRRAVTREIALDDE